MHTSRFPRALRGVLAAVIALLALAGLTGCRSDPSVAAYVGDEQISVSQLQQAVDQRLQDPGVAKAVKGHETPFTRQVLGLLVEQKVYAAVAQQYHLAVPDAQVQDRIDQLLGGSNPDQVYAQLAAQGIGRQDVVENVRQQLLRQRIATAQGLADGLSDQALQARYQKERTTQAQVQFGYITVPDQATADSVLGQLTANPAAYPAVAAQHAGTYTLPQLETRTPDQIPSELADGIAKATPGTGFTVAIPQTGGVVVAFVAGLTYPSFDQMRPQLIREASTEIDDKAKASVDKVRSSLQVRVNPRYGEYKDGGIAPATGGVVDILGSGTPAAGS